ncbi:hypothetical protein ACFQY9_00245 [Microvirga aerilata]|uniref:hypothetical protein n=1 Tax=Microvirga aerilata TaxID=670292 RepID=UPI0036452C3E
MADPEREGVGILLDQPASERLLQRLHGFLGGGADELDFDTHGTHPPLFVVQDRRQREIDRGGKRRLRHQGTPGNTKA